MASDAQTNQAVLNITFTISGVEYHTTPTLLGAFAAGTHIYITASAPGYETDTRDVVVSEDLNIDRQRVTFLLSKILVCMRHSLDHTFFLFWLGLNHYCIQK